MKRKVLLTLGGVALAAGLSAVPAIAAPGDNGNGRGGCVDNLYGNATNERPSGNGVLPSQSPGPWVNNPTDPENPTWGPSVGDAQQLGRAFGLTGGETVAFLCSLP